MGGQPCAHCLWNVACVYVVNNQEVITIVRLSLKAQGKCSETSCINIQRNMQCNHGLEILNIYIDFG